jgi:hypothetical protein
MRIFKQTLPHHEIGIKELLGVSVALLIPYDPF